VKFAGSVGGFLASKDMSGYIIFDFLYISISNVIFVQVHGQLMTNNLVTGKCCKGIIDISFINCAIWIDCMIMLSFPK
jgi:uncharacterized membrane protein